MTRTSTYQDRRRIVRLLEAALVLGTPFVTVRGESAFRFDVPTLTLHVLGATIITARAKAQRLIREYDNAEKA